MAVKPATQISNECSCTDAHRSVAMVFHESRRCFLACITAAPVMMGAFGSGLSGCASKALVRLPSGAERLTTDDGPLEISANTPSRGPSDAKALLVVYSDFDCPFCRDFALSIGTLHKTFAGELRTVFKHRPLPRHPGAYDAAIAAQSVFFERGPEAFWSFHDWLFAHPKEHGARELVGQAGSISPGSLEQARLHVRNDIAEANRLLIVGTPRAYLNRRTIDGAYPTEQLASWIRSEL